MNSSEKTIASIERAIRLMADRVAVGEVPSLEQMAEAAALSKFHFHRVYRLVAGETCSQTLSRLRLAKGLHAVRAGDASVTDAAFAAGYESGQAFAKVLRQQLSESASALSRQPERLASVISELSSGGPVGDTKARQLRVEIARLDPLEVRAIRTAGRYPKVASTYIDLFREIGGAENVRAIIGIPYGNDENGLAGELIFDCGFVLKEKTSAVGPDRVEVAVGGGTYLLGRHVGSYSELPRTLNILYRWIIGSEGVSFGDTTCVFHYLDDPEQTPESRRRTDLYVPVALVGEHIRRKEY